MIFLSRVKHTTLLFIISMSICILFPGKSHSQIIVKSIIDLRTGIAGHGWTFHPGDSPVISSLYDASESYSIDNDDDEAVKNTSEEISFAWASEKLSAQESIGWIDDIEIQLSWMRYRDKNGNKPFHDFSSYMKQYNGYGWYRTTFTIDKTDFASRFRSRDLVLRLGKIGQADAVYLNGRFIGGTGLKADSVMNEVLPDEKLFYDRTRYYSIPRELLKYNSPNVLAVRVYAKYPIAPGLSHDKYYIASSKKIERSQFWDNFKKIFVIVLTTLLGLFYIYWNFVFRDNDRASIYFAFTAFAMALSTFMESQIVYSIFQNALWIKKIEFMAIVIFVHMLIEFISHFSKIDTTTVKVINRIWDILGVAVVVVIALLPDLLVTRRFMMAWAVAPAMVSIYMFYLIIRGRKIPSMATVATGLGGLILLMANDVLVGFQFRWVMWEFSLKDYAFAFFAVTIAGSIVTNMKKSRELIAKQKEEKERLAKFFSPDVIEEILSGDLSLGGQEKKIATLFADIVGFTKYSETQTPAKVLERLNEMFTRISTVITEYQATLDKYIGDCVMAFWGAPKPTPNDAYNAVACALAMQREMRLLAEKLPPEESPFHLRVGINFGPAIAGLIGSPERMDFSVIGDAVNTASRIEGSGIPGKVAISESTFIAAGGDKYIRYSEVREVEVKGKSMPIKVYIVEEVLPLE